MLEQNNVTAEDVQRFYSAALDSVNLLKAGKPEFMTQEEWKDAVKRNVEHLQVMLTKDFWTTQDLEPLQAAISANK